MFEYGKRMQEIREKNNISQESIASVLDIKRSTYGHYETQYQTIPINHLITFCEYFNISIDYIFNLTDKLQYNNSKNFQKETSALRLKEFRKNNKLTQSELANILNTTKTVICGYEKGRYIIATPFLYMICKKFNISADYLLGKTEN